MKNELKHIVLFKFLSTASENDINNVIDSFLALKEEIPLIQNIEWGKDVSIEQKNEGFTHCFCLTFNNEKDRNDYLPHPAHKEFGEKLKPIKEKVLVFDYFVGK